MKRKILLNENEIPEKWYNIIADMPNKPLPPLNPETLNPIGPESLAPLFPMELIKQEVTTEKYVEIANTSQRSGELKFGHKEPNWFGSGSTQYACQILPM